MDTANSEVIVLEENLSLGKTTVTHSQTVYLGILEKLSI